MNCLPGGNVNSKSEKIRLKNYLLLAREFKTQQLWDKAVQTLQQALTDFPGHPYLLMSLTDIYIKMGSLLRAQQSLQQLLKNSSNHGYADYLLASLAFRSGKYQKAKKYYQKALNQNLPLKPVLKGYLSLLIQHKQAGEALKIIEPYKRKLRNETWFVLLWIEALLKIGKKVQALRILNNRLKERIDRELFLKYLEIKYLVDDQDPLITYRLLTKQFTDLPELSERELRNLKVDYLVHRKKFNIAEKTIQEYINLSSQKLYWTRQMIRLRELEGDRKGFLAEAVPYFLGNPADLNLALKLEKAFINSFRLADWYNILQNAFFRHPTNPALFRYLRLFYQKRNWLQNCMLTFPLFVEQVESLKLKSVFTVDSSWRRIPQYAFEYFCFTLNFTGKILQPEELYSSLVELQGKNPKLLPFDRGELEGVYPLWIFALHLYFLMKSVSQIPMLFNPDFFYQYGIDLFLKLPRHTVAVDISPLINFTPDYSQDWFKNAGIKILRWPSGFSPAHTVSGIPLFRAQEISSILNMIKSQTYTLE